MADAKTVSPLLDDFSLGSPFSSHNGIICCPAIHAVTKEKFILKQVSVPESQTQVNAMLLTGACADQTAAQSYYEDVTHGLEEEIRLLERLAQTRGFAPFYSHQSTPKANGEVGMDLWVLSPYRTTLSAYARRNAMTHLNAVNLGIDLCAALTLSRKAGYLYQNLKPDNIFVTSQRQFQLGDFGFLPLEDLPYATFPAKYRGPFAAPELFDDFGEMNATIDLYALGMVLYLVYNGGQGPFAESQEGAEARRLKGEALPPPAYADYEMAADSTVALLFRPGDGVRHGFPGRHHANPAGMDFFGLFVLPLPTVCFVAVPARCRSTAASAVGVVSPAVSVSWLGQSVSVLGACSAGRFSAGWDCRNSSEKTGHLPALGCGCLPLAFCTFSHFRGAADAAFLSGASPLCRRRIAGRVAARGALEKSVDKVCHSCLDCGRASQCYHRDSWLLFRELQLAHV